MKKKQSKRFTELKQKVDKDKTYDLEEAITLVKETATTKFDSSVEVHVRLGIDPKKGEQQVRSTVVLPHGIGKVKRIAVFTEDKQKEAKDAGADLVGGKQLIDEIKKTGKLDFDIAIATPDMMKELAVIAKVLGPRGLMPSPKNDTITTDIAKAVDELKKGKIAFKNDETANVHQVIGKASFDDKQLTGNYQAFIEALEKAKPDGIKGTYIKKICLCSTMGPSVCLLAS